MSKPDIEITIPATKSEVKLLTADKYCESDIVVKNELSFRTATGFFTPNEDTTILSLTGLPSNVKLIKIRPEGDVGDGYTTPTVRLPINYFCGYPASGDGGRKGLATSYIQYSLSGEHYGETIKGGTYNSDAGTIYYDIKKDYFFVANVTYNWTAYCWDD